MAQIKKVRKRPERCKTELLSEKQKTVELYFQGEMLCWTVIYNLKIS